ncbi:MAG: LssY C-terminal domain-containing protein [Patescibacteria group bacterium]
MKLFLRIIQRLLIFIVAIPILWFIATQIFTRLDRRLPAFVALIVTYIFSAYLLLPELIRIIRQILRRKYIPRTTHAADGLSADPVNIILTGTYDDLQSAFKAAGWYTAERLTLRTGLKIITHFVRNKPYPEAPFSPLFLFGRMQDFGFEKPISNSPRQRDHIRFWAATHDPVLSITDINYWIAKEEVDLSKATIWVGAATRDTGFGLTQLTYEISHRIDKHIDNEREYILHVLEATGWIQNIEYINPGEWVAGKYITDGKIVCAKLVAPIKK